MNEYYSNSGKPEAIEHSTSEELINERETLKAKKSHIPLQMEDIINTGPAVFFLWSIEKNWPVDLVSANVNQFGYSAEEFLSGNLPYSAIVFPDDFKRISDALNNDIQEGSLNPLILEYRLLTKTKEIRWIDDRRVARRNDHGEITHYQGVIIDITHRKRMGEEILKAEKLESFEIMASGIAHDFNNMLSVILGNINFAKMILKAEDPANKKLTEAEIACGRAKELAQQLMSFTYGDSIHKEVTSLPALIMNAVRFALNSSQIETEYDFDENLFPAEIDEGQIMRAIINIVNNAGEAMPDGGMIRIKAENLSIRTPHDFLFSPGEYVKITIQDQGHGIPEQVLGRIFDPYFTTKSLKNEKSTGMGLAMSYSIIKNHKGHITVESSEGIGTTFCLYLPASTKSLPHDFPQETDKTASKGRILFMDDEKMIRDVTGALLTHMGYEVSCVGDGIEVIELYQKAREENKPFSCVILDLTIPGGMGGRRTMQKLLELDPEIKVIISSGYGNDPLIQDFQKFGFKGAITKPYKIEKLIDTLQRTIK